MLCTGTLALQSWEEIVHFPWQALMVFVTINSSHWYENKGEDFFFPAVFVIFLYDVCDF